MAGAMAETTCFTSFSPIATLLKLRISERVQVTHQFAYLLLTTYTGIGTVHHHPSQARGLMYMLATHHTDP